MVELPHGVLHLVRLQVPDEMPFDRAPQSLCLVQRLLHTVLADVHNPRIDGSLHRLDGVILRHGNQLHGRLCGHMRAACACGFNRRTHLLNPRAYHHIVTHLSSITAASRPVLPPAAR